MLGDFDSRADRSRKCCAKHLAIANLNDSVAALALLWLAGALELNQVRTPRMLLPQLQPTMRDIEIRVPLPELAAVLRAKCSARLKGAAWVRVACLQLDVPSRSLHRLDCDG